MPQPLASLAWMTTVSRMGSDSMSVGTPVRSADGAAIGVIAGLLDSTAGQTGPDCYYVEAVRDGRPMGPEVWVMKATHTIQSPADLQLLQQLGLVD